MRLAFCLLLIAGCADPAPHIVTFSASAGEVLEGGRVDIEWSVVDVSSVEVSLNGTTLGTGTSGSTRSPALDQEATFDLAATGEGGTAKKTLVVRVRPLDDPAVAAFSVDILAVAETTTTTIQWATERAASVELLVNGAVVHEDTAVPAGRIDVSVDAGDELVVVARRGDRSGRSDPIVVEAAAVETEPNDAAIEATLISEPIIIGGTSPDDPDVFRLSVASGELVDAELSRLDGTCDGLLLELRSQNADPPVVYTADYAEGCPRIDPDRMWRAIGGLPRVPVLLYVWSTEPTGYILRARTVPPECGNGRVEVWAGEGCDDGNTTAGDGCDDTCRPPSAVVEAVPNSRSDPHVLGAPEGVVLITAPLDDDDHYFSIEVPAGADLIVTNRSEGPAHACVGAAELSVSPDTGPTNVLIERDDGCERRVLLADQTDRSVLVYVEVERPSQLEWRVGPAACGNGVREAGEACDGEPGCAADCTFDSSDILPGEGAVTITGTLEAGGVYGVPVTLTSNSHLIASVTDTADGRCAASNPQLRLERVSGAYVAQETHVGPGLCPVLDARVSRFAANLPPGEYHLIVQNSRATFDFELAVELGRPRCGDGVLDAGETCDDRNATSGDGCDDTCRIEPSVLEPLVESRFDAFELDGVSSFRAFSADVVPGTDVIADSLTPAGSCFSPTQVVIATESGETRSVPTTCRGAKRTATATGAVSIGYHRRAYERGWHYAGVSVIHPVCGDGYVSTFNETCDDVDQDPNDGCTACRFDPGPRVEVEPNQSRTTAMVLTATVSNTAFLVAGALSGDTDMYRVDVSSLPAGTRITATTFSDLGDVGSCTIDTQLAITTFGGVLLDANDDYNSVTCSQVSVSGVLPAEYLIIVNGDAGFYLMAIEVT